MNFAQPLQACRLIKRYKRFLADVIHPQRGEITVHCPNTGSMKNCWKPGDTAWIMDSGNAKRKYRYSWMLIENEKHKIGINTTLANSIVFEAIQQNQIKQLANYTTIQKEVTYGNENSRIDILLTDNKQQSVYIEIKSVTLLEDDGVGYFPDAVSERGQKHLRELIECVAQGNRAVLFFLVQHTGIKKVAAASHIDANYALLFKQAIEAGVEVMAYTCKISTSAITLHNKAEVLY